MMYSIKLKPPSGHRSNEWPLRGEAQEDEYHAFFLVEPTREDLRSVQKLFEQSSIVNRLTPESYVRIHM